MISEKQIRDFLLHSWAKFERPILKVIKSLLCISIFIFRRERNSKAIDLDNLPPQIWKGGCRSTSINKEGVAKDFKSKWSINLHKHGRGCRSTSLNKEVNQLQRSEKYQVQVINQPSRSKKRKVYLYKRGKEIRSSFTIDEGRYKFTLQNMGGRKFQMQNVGITLCKLTFENKGGGAQQLRQIRKKN